MLNLYAKLTYYYLYAVSPFGIRYIYSVFPRMVNLLRTKPVRCLYSALYVHLRRVSVAT